MTKYVEIALGSVSNRGRAIPISEIPALQKQAYENKLELFRSYYFFDYSLVEHLNVYKTVKGFIGTPIIDMITLDIDKGTMTDEQVHRSTIAMVYQLKDLGISDVNIRPYYSGQGYHLVLPNLWNFKTVQELKDTLTHLFPECDSIYDRARLLRVSNTINAKSSRYKVPLTHQQLFNLTTKEILEYSLRSNDTIFPSFDYDPSQLEHLKVKSKPIVQEQPAMVHDEGLSNVIMCIQRMYNNNPQQGSRHKTILRMVSVFKRNGIPRSGIETMVREWSKGEVEIGEIRKIVSDVFDKNYQFSCQDEIMSKWCDKRCLFYKKKSYNSTLPRRVEEIETYLKSTINEVQTRFIDISHILQLKQPFFIYPEEFVVIEGDKGLGKSALVQNIMVKARDFKTLYLNFEVGERLMYRRFLQIANGMTKIDVLQHYSQPDAPTLSHTIGHIHMISEKVTVPTLENIIVNGKYDMVIADPLEDFITPGIHDITPRTEFIAPELKRLANRYKMVVVAIHHISKGAIQDAQGHTKKLTVHAGKGSSAVEQKADKVILLEGSMNSPYRHIRSAAARDEQPFDTTMMFDAERTFRFYKEPVWTSENSSETNTSTSAGTSTEPVSLLEAGPRFLP